MRLRTGHRRRGAKPPRIDISQEEITADLVYPARLAPAGAERDERRRRRR